jgi:ATP-binding cassette, subfamily C, bacteriocin exporter
MSLSMKKPVKIRQHDITDCGVACLASIAEYRGLKFNISTLRMLANTDRDGTNLLGLIEAASKIGFIAKGVRCPPENLRHIPVPAIAHIKLKNGFLHFIVIYRVRNKKLVLMDPADGSIRKIYLKDFISKWTGILVLLVPGTDSKKGNFRVSSLRRIIELIQSHYGLFIQAFLGAAVYSILGLSVSVYVQKIVDNILPEQNLNLLNLLSIIVLLILGFRTYISVIKSHYLLKTGQHIDGTLIMGYYWHLLRSPARFIDTMRTGELISRINDAVKIRAFISNSMIDIVVSTLTIIVSIILACFISIRIAALLLIILPLFGLIFWLFNRFNRSNLREVMEKSADFESQLVESLNNISTIRYLNSENQSFDKAEGTFARFLSQIYINGRNSILANNGTSFLAGLATISLLWTGSVFVFRQDLTPGQLMLLYSLFGYLLGPLSSLVMMSRTIQDALIAADRLFQILDIEEEIDNSKYLVNLKSDTGYDIHFENVTFGYGNRAELLRNLNFKIISGEMTGIAGESGSGKSTIAALLMRIYPVKSGRIRVGDTDILDVELSSLRKIIGIVPQRIDLFSGNFIDNIVQDIRNIDIRKVHKVCEEAGILEFIDSLPSGFYTKIGERGYTLSGGEIQKIAIARALYRDPSILIMDEATSSLDPNAEIIIRRLIRSLKAQSKTIILIAHRLNSLMHCDKIICLHDKAVAEYGSHIELLKKQGYYCKLWHNQFARDLIE